MALGQFGKVVKALISPKTAESEVQLQQTLLGNLAIAQVEPGKLEAARQGIRYCAVIGNGATFLAPVTAYPTTTAAIALYNASTDKILAIQKLFSFLASGTPAAGGILLACVTKVSQSRPTLSTGDNGGYAGVVQSSLSGYGGQGNGIFINNQTLTGEQPAWFPAAVEPTSPATASIGAHACVGDFDGLIAVPPGYMLGLTMLSGSGTSPLYGFGAIWDELALPVG